MTYCTLSPGVKDFTLKGPVPIGALLMVHVFGSVQVSSCAFWSTTPCRFVNGRYQLAVACLKVIFTVVASGVSMLAILSYCDRDDAPFSGFATNCHVALTSAEVNGVPSDHLTPLFNVHVTLLPSAATEPSVVEGMAFARTGTSG